MQHTKVSYELTQNYKTISQVLVTPRKIVPTLPLP